MKRREFLLTSGLGLAAGALGVASGCRQIACVENSPLPSNAVAGAGMSPAAAAGSESIDDVIGELRRGLLLDPDFIHLSGMLIVSHPRSVREAIEGYREELDVRNAPYVQGNRRNNEHQVREAAARYLGARPQEISLTGNTTSGLGLVYAGILIREDQSFVTTEHDYYSTRASLDFQSRRSGAAVNTTKLFDRSEQADPDEMVERLMEAVDETTRVVALTWVHSSTGVKIPVARISAALEEVNVNRAPRDRAILVLDAVHGLGVEDVDVGDLGCDAYVAGTHKWLLAPRGTGIVWGHPRVHEQILPTIPTFTRGYAWGGDMTPGGYHAFEHQWAAAEAFELHMRIGRTTVTERIHGHARAFKEGMREMQHVTVRTPMNQEASAGVVCFDLRGMQPRQVVNALLEQGIIATVTPAPPYHARLSPAVFNTSDEIETTLAAIGGLG